MHKSLQRKLRICVAGVLFGVIAPMALGAKPPLQAAAEEWTSAVHGKWIVYSAQANDTLEHLYIQEMAKDAKALGMKFTYYDSGFNSQVQQQTIQSLIPKKPDILIVHDPDVTVLQNVLKQAQEAGIPVIQINMTSNTRTDAFVGVNPVDDGRLMADAALEGCTGPGARSNKVALMNGAVTSSYSMGIQEGILEVLKAHKIEVVSDQAADWDPQKAHDKAATVLQAHPDLCAYIGRWSGQDFGIAKAVQQAGLAGKVRVITTDGGEPPVCDYIRDGLIYADISYQARMQATQMITMAQYLLQAKLKPGSIKATLYTPLKVLTKDTLTPDSCTPVEKLPKQG